MPNQRQIKSIRRIVSKDCLIEGANIDDKCRTCVVGALALASGTSVRTLMRNREGSINWLPVIVIKRIMKKFGLSKEEIDDMQNENDTYLTAKKRRHHILKLPFLQPK